MPIMMIFAVVVIALIVVAGIFAGQQLLSGGNLSTSQTEIGTIVAKVQSLYSSQPNYKGLNTASAISAGIFPQNMVNGTSAVNPFGGTVQVFDINTGAGNGGANLYHPAPSFAVQFDGLSEKDCIALETTVTDTATFVTASVTTPISYATQQNVTGQPVTVTQAESGCGNTVNAGGNSVAFVFTKSSN